MSFETMNEEQLVEHLNDEAARRGYEFRIESSGDRWRAAFLFAEPDPLGMRPVRWSAEAADRRTALKELAYVLDQDR